LKPLPDNGCDIHPGGSGPAGRPCAPCRRKLIIDAAAAADPALPRTVVAAAVDAVLTHRAVTRDLVAALTADPGALLVGAPPVVGRLVGELRGRGADLPEPTCVRCGRTGWPLTRSDSGGVCKSCRHRQLAQPCFRCGVTKPVGGRDPDGQPVCARCADRPQRLCGRCGRIRRIARRAHDGQPDICDSCYAMPAAVCSRCHEFRPCSFASGPDPVCTKCAPRNVAVCAHCGQERPPVVLWPEGPVCDTCYTAALRRRGRCADCHTERRLVAPPGPDASRCADCAGLPTTSHVCTDCGIEDKLYERGRCNRCALIRRTRHLLSGGGNKIPPVLVPVYQSITATSTPRTALNWLRKGAGAATLAEVAAGTLELSHAALDAHPKPQAASYLRHVLVANGVLPARDEALAATERFVTVTLAGIGSGSDRRLVHAYSTWTVLRRLRRSAATSTRPRTYTHHAHLKITAAAAFLAWLAAEGRTLEQANQADVDRWLTGGPARYDVRGFLQWAAQAGHTRPLHVPTRSNHPGGATTPDERWKLLARLLHDDTIDLTDRVAGCLLLLYGQQLSRLTAMTTQQLTVRDGRVFVRFGGSDIHVPEPLAGLLQTLAREGRRYRGVGSPSSSNWLFPGMMPGRPLNPASLGERLRKQGVYAQAGRRATLTHLAAQLPAAVIADLLNLAPTTAVNWVRDAGGDWTRYAADLAHTAITNHDE
jgi:hypothetical protein